MVTLDEARLPAALLTNPRRYLDRLNFATNFCFFRDQDGLSTRLVTANYWAGYGAGPVRLWLRLFDADGRGWPPGKRRCRRAREASRSTAREVRARFGLPEFTGQLFVHAIGVAGHDVVKYALDTFGAGNDASLSCTHDANAWPSDRYAGLPAPAAGRAGRPVGSEQPCRADSGRRGALDRMGAERPVALRARCRGLPPWRSMWRTCCRACPGRRKLKCERGGTWCGRATKWCATDAPVSPTSTSSGPISPGPGHPGLPAPLGRGYLLPLPVLPRRRFRTLIQPTPMATTQAICRCGWTCSTRTARRVAERFLGCLPRDHAVAVDLDDLLPADALRRRARRLVYDFRDGGGADGWLHALVRAEDRTAATPPRAVSARISSTCR